MLEHSTHTTDYNSLAIAFIILMVAWAVFEIFVHELKDIMNSNSPFPPPTPRSKKDLTLREHMKMKRKKDK